MPKLIGTAPNQVPTNGSLGNMAFQNKEGVITDLLSTTALTVTGTGAASFAGTIAASLGSAAAPSYTFTGDTNTGIFSPAADTIAFSEGGAEAMRINSVGDVGIGTATPDNYTGRSALSVNGSTGGIITLQSAGTQKLRLFTGASSSAIGTLTGTLDVSTGDASALSFSTNVLERMRIDGVGQVGIGGTASNGTTLRIGKSLTGAAIGLGVYNNQAIQSDVTTSAQLFSTFASTAATAFTLSSLSHYIAGFSGIGAGSVITSQSGFTATASLVGATNNYGFLGSIPDGAGRWNFYAGGTAPNYFAGKVGIGTTAPNASALLDVTSTTSGFLPPRMTTTQRNAIATPADGLVVYNTTIGALEVRQAGQWVNPSTAGIVNTPVAMETDFINEYYTSRRSARTFDQLIDFTRTTSGTFVGSNGLIQTTPASVNLLLQTQQFDNAAWTKGDAAVTANATTAPDGTATADLLTETATTNFHFVLQAVTTAAGAATATVYAKLASGSRNLVVYPQGTTVGYAIFNLSTGAITASGGGALLSSSITPAGNGWYRCSVSWTASAASTNFVCYLTNSTTNPAPNYAGDGTSGIFLWGAQLELGSTATTYTRNNGGRFPARFDYDPATLAPKGILIEEQRVNRTLQSEDFTVSPWAATVVGTSTRVNDNSALGFMRGLVTATSANGGIRQTFASLTSGQVYALSFYIQSTTTAVSVFMENGTASFGAPHNVTINPSNGTAGALTGFTSVTITPFSSGYIYTLITAPAGGTLSANFEWRIVANGGSMLYGRPQFEAGAFATSYIPTVASQVTRTADQCAIVAPNFAPWYNAREGSLVVSGDWYGISGNDYWAAIDDASVNNGVGLRADPFGGNYGLVRSGGADQASMYLDQLTANTVYNMAVAYKVNDFAACRNGGTVQTDGLGSVPVAPTRLSIGDGFTASGNILNGHIRSIRYYPVRLTNTQLQALTT